MPGGKMGATTIPIKWILKKYYDWEHKSYNEQIIIKYRIKNVLATILCLLPLPIGMLFTFFGSDKEMRGGIIMARATGSSFGASAIGQSSSSRSVLVVMGTESAGRLCWPGRLTSRSRTSSRVTSSQHPSWRHGALAFTRLTSPPPPTWPG